MLFLKGYHVPTPAIVLNRIVHWQAQVDLLTARSDFNPNLLGESLVWVFGGYFYNFSTPSLAEDEISQGLKEGRKHGATTFLVPAIRDSEAVDSLLGAGFTPLPCFVESVFELETSVEGDFRKRVSRHRFAEIRRLGRNAHRAYDLRFYKAPELEENPALLTETSRLHELNVRQHNLHVNFYNRDVLEAIMSSTLRDNLLVGLRYDKSTGVAVQAMIILVCEDTGELYFSAQGIDHDEVDRRHNLYTTAAYDLYKYGEAHGLRTFYLGRGSEEEKQRLGANRYHLLNHWMKSDEKGFDGEVKKLADATLEALALDPDLSPRQSPTTHT